MLSDGDGSPAVFFLCGTGSGGQGGARKRCSLRGRRQSALTGEMQHEGSWQNMMSAQTLLEARDAKPDACTDTFTMIHSVLDEVVMREQAGMRSLLSKLLAVVVWVMLLVCVVCRILSRRYGCRMIYHWENIYYIHQTDGKKGDCLLNYLHI